MVDVGTGLAALGSAQVSKDALGRMLGPTADYIGEGVRSWSERRTANVQRVFAIAYRRLGDGINRPGAVPPRVLKAVLDEAQVAEDELVAEYLGGVLASSRTEVGRDDRAAAIARLISSLSSYAIRTHYLFYAATHSHVGGAGDTAEDWSTGKAEPRSATYITDEDYKTAMAFSDVELANFGGIIPDTILTLDRHDLVENWAIAKPEALQQRHSATLFPGDGVVYQPTMQGVVLFCAAHGCLTDPFAAFVSGELAFDSPDAPPIPPSSLVNNMPRS